MSGNLLRGLPASLPEELFTTLAEARGVRIERIVSTGQSSPEGFWCDQAQAEFVLLLEGAAGLEMQGEAVRALAPGDWVVIPPHAKHRVAWTERERATVWLAVHFEA